MPLLAKTRGYKLEESLYVYMIDIYCSVLRRLQVKMIRITVKLIFAVTCFTATTEAAGTCHATKTSCLPGLPGRDGKDGQPGRDGLPGPPGTFTYSERQQLKQDVLEMLQEEISKLSCSNTPNPSTHQSLQCSAISTDMSTPPILPTTSQQITQSSELGQATLSSFKPTNSITTSTVQFTFSPQPTPQPEPQCSGHGTTVDNPATSCKEIYHCNPTAPSGYYWISTTSGPLQVYCQMDTNNCGDITGGWMRAAYIDMTNENNTCPQELNYTVVNSTRMCTQSDTTNSHVCSSVTFPTHHVPYKKVCGKAHGYQFSYAYAFYKFGRNTLDSSYVSGLSVTYGSPRNHIWTFAAGYPKDTYYYYQENHYNCPCADYIGPDVPPFVGESYFCESGGNATSDFPTLMWYFDDPLWDSQGCAGGSTCCDRGGPWFTTTLSQEVRGDIELRLCNVGYNANIGVDQFEILIY